MYRNRGNKLSTLSRRRARGFTLLELLVVILVMALVAGVVAPRFASALPGAQFKQTGREMLVVLRQARQRAMTGGRESKVSFDRQMRRYGDPAGGPLAEWGRDLEVQLSLPQALPGGGETPSVVFYPDGSSSGARIELAQGHRSMTIDVDWLSGAVVAQ